jgi:glycosyltransferase involved in cell wall biosynthesis
MRILMLVPQPFYTERGTPIAVDLLLRELSNKGHEVDLITYHLGADRDFRGLRTFRIRPWPRPRGVAVGFSFAKIYCDLFMLARSVSLLRRGRYDVVHAVEESVFIAMLLRLFFRVPYVYDMDSWMSSQLCDRFKIVRPLRGMLEFFESLAVKRAIAVVPMCDALVEKAAQYRSAGIHVLRDVSLQQGGAVEGVENLREQLHMKGSVLMYIGNLEPYQGIDLLLESFAQANLGEGTADLVIIGGQPEHITRYVAKAAALGIGGRTHFIGPRPVTAIGAYMAQADILVSPRLEGTNTPMKVYSYMDSGRALIATDLWTHTQVLDQTMAALAPPEADAFADAMSHLLRHPEERRRLAGNARRVVAQRHSLFAFSAAVSDFVDSLQELAACEGRGRGSG